MNKDVDVPLKFLLENMQNLDKLYEDKKCSEVVYIQTGMLMKILESLKIIEERLKK